MVIEWYKEEDTRVYSTFIFIELLCNQMCDALPMDNRNWVFITISHLNIDHVFFVNMVVEKSWKIVEFLQSCSLTQLL